MQLDIFSVVPNSSSGDFPRAITPVDPKVEEACNVKFAVVEVDMYGSTIEYSCNIKNLEVVE
jgi:hypothetical protein